MLALLWADVKADKYQAKFSSYLFNPERVERWSTVYFQRSFEWCGIFQMGPSYIPLEFVTWFISRLCGAISVEPDGDRVENLLKLFFSVLSNVQNCYQSFGIPNQVHLSAEKAQQRPKHLGVKLAIWSSSMRIVGPCRSTPLPIRMLKNGLLAAT